VQYPVSVYAPQVSKSSVIALRNYRKDVELQAIIVAVQAETYLEQVQAYRASGLSDDKCRLPGFCASGVYSPMHSAEHFKRHNGLMSVDIDRLETLEEAQDMLARAAEMSFIVAGFVSPSGLGIKLFAAVDTEFQLTDKSILTWHRTYWAALSAYVCNELGVSKENEDTKNGNPNRMCFLSADPYAFFNDDPAPINPEELPSVSASAAIEPKVDFNRAHAGSVGAPAARSQFSHETAFEFICNKVRNHPANPCDFTPGFRHYFTSRIAYLLNRQGVPKTDALKLIRDRFAAASTNIEHHLSSVASIYIANTGEFGINIPARIQHQSINNDAQQEPVLNAPANCTPADYRPDWHILKALYDNEAGDADLLSEAFKAARIFDHTNKAWMTYAGPHWVRDEKKSTHAEMQRWLVDQFKPAKKALGEIVELSQDKQTKELYGLVKDRVWQLNGKKRIDNVLDLATKRLGAVADDFDQHPTLFAFKVGVMDLKTGEIQASNPSLLLTKAADYEYDLEAETPKFQAFLDTILPDQEVQKFVQRFIGICLTGEIMAQGLLFAYGHGKNGKSTFFALMNRLLGGYQVQMQTERFMGRQPNGSATADYYTVKLKGARLAVGTEIPTTFAFDEAQIKALTGGDVISAREIYSQVITFKPTHKLALFGNHKPHIKGADEGIWRRIWLVPFTVTIAENKRRNQEELMEELTNELPGIWNWAFAGLKDVQRNGWRVPNTVAAATDDYRADTDALGEFIGEKLVKDPQGKVLINELFRTYNEWIQKEMISAAFNSTQTFRKAFEERGHSITRDAKNKRWLIGFKHAGDHDARTATGTMPPPASPAKPVGNGLTKLVDRKKDDTKYNFLDDLEQPHPAL